MSFRTGDRVRLRHPVGRLGANYLPEGTTGKVTFVEPGGGVTHVLFDGDAPWQFEGTSADDMLEVCQ